VKEGMGMIFGGCGGGREKRRKQETGSYFLSFITSHSVLSFFLEEITEE
jgi:hypothetical protein